MSSLKEFQPSLSLLSAVKLIPPGERPVWGSSLLVMQLLQVLSCSTLMEALTDPQTQAKNQSLATSLLQTIEGDMSSPVQVQGHQQTSYFALFMTNRCLNPACTFKKTPGLSVMRHIFFSHFALQNSTQLTLPLSTWYSELQVATSVLRQVSADPAATLDWLYSVQSALPLCEHVPDALTLLLSHLILSSEGDVCRLALDTAAGIAEADPAQVEP